MAKQASIKTDNTDVIIQAEKRIKELESLLERMAKGYERALFEETPIGGMADRSLRDEARNFLSPDYFKTGGTHL